MTARALKNAAGLVTGAVEGFGSALILLGEAVYWLFRRPFRVGLFLQQMEFVGAGSLFIVVLTGLFTGMVFAVQTVQTFRLFNAETLVGSTVSLALMRELAPVLTALMVTARVGSAIATELGTMRVTEQVDALYTMAVNPVQYLVTPRIAAAVVMLPILTAFCDVIGIGGAYHVSVSILNVDGGMFMDKIAQYADRWDVISGLIKACVFGLILALVGCYKGLNAKGGARGVGRATTQTVVTSSVLILISDYFLTLLLYRR
ncbi:MAG: ABC transporter permease [Deltaproteobacteria bacterium]|nr:ABC transporter permease [Deltaproteobacteria bacterium]